MTKTFTIKSIEVLGREVGGQPRLLVETTDGETLKTRRHMRTAPLMAAYQNHREVTVQTDDISGEISQWVSYN